MSEKLFLYMDQAYEITLSDKLQIEGKGKLKCNFN